MLNAMSESSAPVEAVSAPDPFAPAKLGPVTLPNRIIKAATFEGRTPEGLVTDELIEFHRSVALGGAGLTTVAYCAVAPEGRTHAEQIHVRPEAMPGLRRLTDAVHAEGAMIAAQIGHAGPVANGRSNRAASLSASGMPNLLSMRMTRAVTEADIERITADYVTTAKLCVEAGFDCLEVHLGHHYLLSAFLSPRLNRRKDRYGGDLENRARFPRQVVRAVREAVGDHAAVTAKLNMSDGVSGGLKPEQSLEIAKLLEADGGLDALQLTGGGSLLNPMYLFRGDAPVEEFADNFSGIQKFGIKRMGTRFFREYPYEEAYFLPTARRFKAGLALPLILLGGISRLETVHQAMREGFEFVAMGRALLREPDLPSRWRAGTATDSRCIHCNRCMPTIYSGTYCPEITEATSS